MYSPFYSSRQTFTSVLESVCGVNTKSTILIKAIKANNDVKLLTKQEIDILAERFEIGGRVHYGHFIQFFKEMNNQKSFNRMKSYKAVDGSVQTRSTRPKQSVGLSPFRMSSEWASLKEDVLKNKTYKLNDTSTSTKPLESVSEKGRSTYTNKSSTDNRNASNKNKIEMLNENEYEDEESYDASSPQTSQYNKGGKERQNNFRERVRDRRESRTGSSAGHDEWRESRDGNLTSSSPSDSKHPIKTSSGDRGRSQKTLLNNSDLPDTSIKKNVPPPKPARNTPGKHNDALIEKSLKKNNNEINLNDYNRDNNDRYDKNDNRNSNKNKNNYNNNDNDNNNDYDDDNDNDDYYNRNMSDKKRNIISGSELDFKSDVRGRSGSPRDLRDRNKNQKQNQNKDQEYENRRRDSEKDRGRGSERGRRSPSEAKNIPSRRSRSPDGRSSPENVAVNRRSWRRSLTDSMMWSKSQTMLVDNNDVQGPLKLPQRAQSPDGKGVTKYFPWNRRSNGDSGRSSPVAL